MTGDWKYLLRRFRWRFLLCRRESMTSLSDGLSFSFMAELNRRYNGRELFVVTDSAVAGAGHLETLLAGRAEKTYVIDPPGESSSKCKQ